MALTVDKKKEIFDTYKRAEGDTGSPEVQVALFSERISRITGHLKLYKKDHAARRSLISLVGQRKRLLRYLRKKDSERYKTLVASLKIRSKD